MDIAHSASLLRAARVEKVPEGWMRFLFYLTKPLATAGFPTYRPPSLTLNRAENTQRALRLSVRTTAFHVVKTGSTPVGRAIFLHNIEDTHAALAHDALSTFFTRCSAVRVACATMVRDGLTAVEEGRKLASTT